MNQLLSSADVFHYLINYEVIITIITHAKYPIDLCDMVLKYQNKLSQ